MANNVIFKFGTKAQYDALETKDSSTLYWLSDVKELRKGNDLYGVGTEATTELAGLMSAEDKAKLDNLVKGTGLDIVAADGTINIANGSAGKLVSVNLSPDVGNALEARKNGLYISNSGTGAATSVEFYLEKQPTAADGYSATYKLRRTSGTSVTYVGDEINIPKDLVLQSGSVKTVRVSGLPYSGAEVGDPYIDLILNDPDGTHIYIPAKSLVSKNKAGNGVVISDDNTISVAIDATNANGLMATASGVGLSVATTTTAGAMSPVDKVTLDSLYLDMAKVKSDIADLKASGVGGVIWEDM